MSRVVILDAAPLGLLAAARGTPAVDGCHDWLNRHMGAGNLIVVPEITDYEVRRELVRLRNVRSVRRLDALQAVCFYLPIVTPAMRQAADLWAAARQRGRPTAADMAIDADVILAAQAEEFAGSRGVIATTNVGHISRYYPAELWSAIAP